MSSCLNVGDSFKIFQFGTFENCDGKGNERLKINHSLFFFPIYNSKGSMSQVKKKKKN